MFNKIESYPFSKEGFELAKKSPIEKILNKPITKTTLIAAATVICNDIYVYAQDLDSSGWRLVGIARKGLFWVCMFVSFYGLYMMVLKKDDIGKKIISGAFLTYLGSWLIPEGYLLIQSVFSK